MVIWDLMKPVVAMIQGNCVAGGTEILSIVDIAFVAEDGTLHVLDPISGTPGLARSLPLEEDPLEIEVPWETAPADAGAEE